jgi:multiple sugar transport system ATP-binding protein
MASVTFQKVSKKFDDVVAVADLDLEVADGEFLVLVGPSGSGKSTVLRMTAGLEDVSGGQVLIGDRRVDDQEPKDRDIAMVFQNYALYPHMNVRKNLAFGLRLRKMPKDDIEKRITRVAEMLDLAELLDRKPGQLSGGQRQRVALGRAIVREPAVFLMDEPLSNLDAQLRVATRTELVRLHQRLRTTTLYVTHDQVEAMTMGDRIVVLHLGVLQQVGTARELYERPVNVFVGGFIGSPTMNMLTGDVVAGDGGTAELRVADLRLDLFGSAATRAVAQGSGRLTVGFRPEHLHLAGASDVEAARLRVRAEVIEYLGDDELVHASVGERELLALIPSGSDVSVGEDLDLAVPMEKLHLFDAETEVRLAD